MSDPLPAIQANAALAGFLPLGLAERQNPVVPIPEQPAPDVFARDPERIPGPPNLHEALAPPRPPDGQDAQLGPQGFAHIEVDPQVAAGPQMGPQELWRIGYDPEAIRWLQALQVDPLFGNLNLPLAPPQDGREMRRQGINVHCRDAETFSSIQALLASGLGARNPQKSLDEITAFIRACDLTQQPARLLVVDTQQRMTRLQLASKTLENMSSFTNVYPSQSGPANAKIPTREVCAMLWECIGRPIDGWGHVVSEATRMSLRHQFIFALSESYVWGQACSEGQVQHLAVGLQGYYPQIQIDPQVQQQSTRLVTPVGEFVTTACMRLQYGKNTADLTAVANEAFAEAIAMYRDDAESEKKVREVGGQLKDYLNLSHDVVWDPPSR